MASCAVAGAVQSFNSISRQYEYCIMSRIITTFEITILGYNTYKALIDC